MVIARRERAGHSRRTAATSVLQYPICRLGMGVPFRTVSLDMLTPQSLRVSLHWASGARVGEYMGTVWIRCPATGRRAPTGIQSERITLTDFPEHIKQTGCLVCGGKHNWCAGDAWISPAASPSRANSESETAWV